MAICEIQVAFFLKIMIQEQGINFFLVKCVFHGLAGKMVVQRF